MTHGEGGVEEDDRGYLVNAGVKELRPLLAGTNHVSLLKLC